MGDKESSRGGKARTWNGRFVNIAHRRTPSELTPLIQQNLALQQQVEMLTAQNQHMMHHQMAGHPSTLSPVGSLSNNSIGNAPNYSAPTNYSGSSVFTDSSGSGVYYSQPQLLPPPPQVFGHQRGGSNTSMSSGTHSRQRSMGHVRRHSLAVSEAKRAAQERSSMSPGLKGPAASLGSTGNSGPSLEAAPSASSSVGGSALGSPGPILESVPQFRFPPSPERPTTERFSRSHSRSQSMSSSSLYQRRTPSPQRFQFPPADSQSGTSTASGSDYQPLANQQRSGHRHSASFQGNHARRQSNWQNEGQNVHSHRPRASIASDFSPGQQQQGRKSLFVPYLPQSAIPDMISDGLLVTGTLRVDHKNRSYAYVSTDLLDAEVFIAGSKDRNRALEGDIVAVELLDVNDVWEQKREKEERKKRRGMESNDSKLVETQEGQLRRRGSLKQRAPQKRSDDIEVEGQTLLLREEVGNGDEKPLYSGHVVAILARPAGQLFSGTIGLLRPSSQANKDRQQSHAHSASTSSFNNDETNQNNQPATRPKIVWFKPVDKCVPLMAIPTEQAPEDLVDNPQAYADQIFVAQIKRWPITSLHPFGMLVENLGAFGDVDVSQKAVLRDFNFASHKFNEVATKEAIDIGRQMQAAASELPSFALLGESCPVTVLTPDMAASIGTVDGDGTLAVHVLDVTPFIERGGSVDRELRHKSSGVYMASFESPLVSSTDALEALVLQVGRPAPVVTISINLSSGSVTVKRESIRPTDSGNFSRFKSPASLLRRKRGLGNIDESTIDLTCLLDVAVPARAPLSSPGEDEIILNELMHAVNSSIASELLRSTAVGLNTLVRRQAEPSISRLEKFAELLRLQDVKVDTTTAQTLIRSLSQELNPRQQSAIKATLVKILGRQRYAVAACTNPGELGHYWFGFEAYTHFCRPLLRYADHIVARQVHAMLGTPMNDSSSKGADSPELPSTRSSLGTSDSPRSSIREEEDNFGAISLTPEITFRYDCAQRAQEQSFHLVLSQTLGGSYEIYSGIVTAVYESAFDVVIPELSVEKRVHGDQLPLQKAEFHPSQQLLELFWKSNISSDAFEPERDENKEQQDDLTEAQHQSQKSSGFSALTEEMKQKLVLRKEEQVQEIRPLSEVPILIRAVAKDKIVPSIIVKAVNPFSS